MVLYWVFPSHKPCQKSSQPPYMLGHNSQSIMEHVKISTLDENVNRLTFEPDPPPP